MLRSLARRRSGCLIPQGNAASRQTAAISALMPRSNMGTMKDMMVRAAIDHVTSRIANNTLGAQSATGLQDAEDVDTWRAIVDMPTVNTADNVASSDLYLVSNDLVDVLDLTAHAGASSCDPFVEVGDDLAGLNANIKRILGVDHPVLARVAKYFFDFDGGKKMRPAMVLLMARAVNAHMATVNEHFAGQTVAGIAAAAGQPQPVASLSGPSSAAEATGSRTSSANSFSAGSEDAGRRLGSPSASSSSPSAVTDSINSPVTSGSGSSVSSVRRSVWSPSVHDPTVSYATDGMPEPLARALAERAGRLNAGEAGAPTPVAPLPPAAVFPLQARLAEVTEMIHTASLLHDDVIDTADTRRGLSSANSVFGNKLAVLAGDFLLARASVSLARLRSIPVVELLSTVIEHLVKGEVMQMKSAATSGPAAASREAFEGYLRKTYYKTGSLMANSCKAIAMVGCYPDYVCNAAFKYGLHVGVAFQLIDDLLDYQGTAVSLGKPALADIKAGLATAPVLFAAQQFPVLLPLIERKFEAPGDVDAALRFVAAADGLTATRRLAIAHGQLALDELAVLAPSPARTALAALVSRVLNRTR